MWELQWSWVHWWFHEHFGSVEVPSCILKLENTSIFVKEQKLIRSSTFYVEKPIEFEFYWGFYGENFAQFI